MFVQGHTGTCMLFLGFARFSAMFYSIFWLIFSFTAHSIIVLTHSQ